MTNIFLEGCVTLLTKEKLIQILIKGRSDCYINKSSEYNPYTKSFLYDWEFKTQIDDFIFTDSYRGFNPYSGVEYVYEKNNNFPIWSCDYVGYVKENTIISINEVYSFLKEARASHLKGHNGDLFSNYSYEKGLFKYGTYFEGNINSLLQIEDFYYKNILVAQQVTAGRINQNIL